MTTTTDSRYPYTYAADLIRGLVGYENNNMKLSRSDASVIRTGIANVLGISDVELAEKLADYYKAHEDDITKKMIRLAC